MLKHTVLLASTILLSACSSVPIATSTPAQNRLLLAEVLSDPENVKLARMGCSYEQVQKQIHGVPQEAPYSDLKDAWGARSLEELMKLHGLPESATASDLYSAVRRELERDGTCRKRLNI